MVGKKYGQGISSEQIKQSLDYSVYAFSFILVPTIAPELVVATSKYVYSRGVKIHDQLKFHRFIKLERKQIRADINKKSDRLRQVETS